MKKFLILGNIATIKYNCSFPYFQRNEIWYGSQNDCLRHFYRDNSDVAACANWITNMKYIKKEEPKLLTKAENEANGIEYKPYENFPNIIEVGDYRNIPTDYDGWMGLAVTVMNKFNPGTFELLRTESMAMIDGKYKFCRVILRWK